jgi:CxxC motif-containing protein (DUF1111 family)
MRHSRIHLAMFVLTLVAACAPESADELLPQESNLASGYGVNGSGTNAVFFVDNASWADLHFRVNGGQQLNVRMSVSNNHNEYVVGNLANGAVIDYNFTYFDLACPCAHDSPAARYLHGGTTAPPDAGTPNPGVTAYPVPTLAGGPLTGGSDRSGSVVPLFGSGTTLEPATVIETPQAIITRVGDRVRDRHAREAIFHIYEHFLPLYFRNRTFSIEIVDKVARGGNAITMNLTTVFPMDGPNARAFFRGINTPAEYFYNGTFARVDDLHYTATVDYNAKENRAIRVGDRMEIEVGVFLSQPVEGRFNYYSSIFLFVVGTGGVQPLQGQGPLLDSFPLPAAALSGGKTTLNEPYSNEPDLRFMQMASNLAPVSAQPWVEGRRLFHTDFGDGSHSEPENPVFSEQAGKVGANYVVKSCEACHVHNGRALPPAPGTTLTRAAMKVGEVSGTTVTPHPRLGTAVQPFNTAGGSEGSAQISSWVTQNGNFNDGTSYQLRRPRYAGTGPIPDAYSMRITPPLVGLGLLEAIPETAIAALVDVNDANDDGVSGRMQVVSDRASGQLRMGRFGWKAAQPSLREQIATALNRDMGVKSSLVPTLDCGATQSGCTSNASAITDAALALLVRYVALLGVPARRELANASAQTGEALFTSAGCATCHRPSFTTSAFAPQAELRGQTIHPYTDLLLHDMGSGLADNLPEGAASGAEWRTPPLWGIGLTAGVSGGEAYLHDGRARNLSEAILWHDGEGARARAAYVGMSAVQRSALLAFLATL